MFNARGGLAHLKEFLQKELPILSPELVVVTGDLTDAKSKWKLSSSQFEQEWAAYHAALKESGVLERASFWFDQRGNHDCFDVAGFDHESNHYKVYSSVKEEGYAFHLKKSDIMENRCSL